MQRRQLLKSMGKLGAMGGAALTMTSPLKVIAGTPIRSMSDALPNSVDYKSEFNKALKLQPNLLGFTNVEHDFDCQELAIEGTMPKDIAGTFVRNGPGKHERGAKRYQHLFEGDGMLQQFTIAEGKISHQGKFITTPKFMQEDKANQFLYSGPDTKIVNSLPVSNANMINTANTNVIPVGDDLWALWEGGSATRVDADSLEFKEHITLGSTQEYGQSLKGLPFSAHPKVEANGDIWNFGLTPTGHIVLYHLSPTGQVKNVKLVNSRYRGGMLHDFLVTEKHVLLILPSLTIKKSSDKSASGYFSRTTFNENIPMRVLVVAKSDFSVKREYELAAGFAFHYGNAWEEPNGTIHFDASLYPNVDVLHKLSSIMQGDLTHTPNMDAKTALFTLYVNGSAHTSTVNENSEFPKICDHLVGKRNNCLYYIASKKDSIWSDTVCALNTNTGAEESYHFGADFLVEEHVNICPSQVEGTGYLIGTALHIPTKRTCLNIFNVEHLSNGPLVRAWLPYHLPLGFHGHFSSSAV
ncbi:carotenoid oxygenase family protein [Thalassotalea atypica]|uniref:carotenoid oxygenase family protein n=1 Tax=Thalassotalea atypica TaxID=2054316 RepID=UPI002573584C|nr:carotenoid oxygenase family protein [Thalassotalea atypica]